MSLQALYRLHDHLEAALREVEREPRITPGFKRDLWGIHDRLERLIIAEQAKRPTTKGGS